MSMLGEIAVAVAIFVALCLLILGVHALVDGWHRASALERGLRRRCSRGDNGSRRARPAAVVAVRPRGSAPRRERAAPGRERARTDLRAGSARGHRRAARGADQAPQEAPYGALVRSIEVRRPGPVRVLQSFPHKIGAARICTTAWHQAAGVSAAGGDVQVIVGAVHRELPPAVRVRTTLAAGPVRIPYRLLGRMRAMRWHDHVVARALPRLAGEIDVVHAWPMAARDTLAMARRLGIPTVLERPNAHTRFAYDVVRAECERLGVALPADHEHAFNAATLRLEEQEYALADRLLCPSDFVVRTFVDAGFAPEQPRASRLRLRRPAVPPADDTAPIRPAAHGPVRRGVCGAQGRPLRARGVAALFGQRDRALPDRGGVPARLRATPGGSPRPTRRRAARPPR